MEDIAPLLQFVIQIRLKMEQGESLRTAIKCFVQEHQTDFHPQLLQLLAQGEVKTQISSPLRSTLYALLARGLAGESILPALSSLEREIKENCEDQIQKFVGALPIRLLIPLLLFQFPAFLILLLGPLVSNLVDSLTH